MDLTITEHFLKTDRHECFYLASGPEDGPLMIFVHGWPELAISWRHQLPIFAGLGFRCIAPDMRGYGRSSVPQTHDAYALPELVQDMLDLLAAQGRDQAVWVGHDWGSPVVWSIASHHPEVCAGVASLCVPYRMIELGLDHIIDRVDREVYPQEEFPAGQWEYMRFYQESFERACAGFEADPYRTAKAIFRAGNPDGLGQPSRTAFVRKYNGWFGPDNAAPDMPRDASVLTEADLTAYASAMARTGFFGADSYYMNDENNIAYSKSVKNDGMLEMPVLFIGARYDYTCETVSSGAADHMADYCSNLTHEVVDSGHWMAQEKPIEVNRLLAKWINNKVLK